MSGVATAVAGASIVGGLIQGGAAQSAAGKQAGAENQAAQLQYDMFNQEYANEQPFIQAGQTATNEINQNMGSWNSPFTMGDFYSNENPGYQFQLQQGEAALQAGQAAGGHEYGTGTMAALNNYAQGMASNQYQNAFQNYQTQISNSYSRLAGVAGMGQAAAANQATTAGNFAGQIGANITGAGNAAAAGQVGTANAINGAIGGVTNGMTYNSMMNQLNPTQTQPTGPTSASINSQFQQPGMQLQMPDMGSGAAVSSLY